MRGLEVLLALLSVQQFACFSMLSMLAFLLLALAFSIFSAVAFCNVSGSSPSLYCVVSGFGYQALGPSDSQLSSSWLKLIVLLLQLFVECGVVQFVCLHSPQPFFLRDSFFRILFVCFLIDCFIHLLIYLFISTEMFGCSVTGTQVPGVGMVVSGAVYHWAPNLHLG